MADAEVVTLTRIGIVSKERHLFYVTPSISCHQCLSFFVKPERFQFLKERKREFSHCFWIRLIAWSFQGRPPCLPLRKNSPSIPRGQGQSPMITLLNSINGVFFTIRDNLTER